MFDSSQMSNHELQAPRIYYVPIPKELTRGLKNFRIEGFNVDDNYSLYEYSDPFI